ncbi:hypothetical protein COS78_01695 [Candidatus Shapirobacteria bacterium CG06_land_8_20_14_3_00_40_12]|uniref:R3H domain-containing protein n=2 Tax=Candidatus Shapironibacteriota TaxID=1752721 RepID=A0A2M7TS23_9BACT|nr:MAG: hypothetical protein COS78_01695 [Candidatus Shapirobacteria bacterium CG06_land_8_20_14_3_00_40_12]PIZ58335.1 MAG: hypothetical protein COY20_03765 [Candidatus Shapirobacteria bacterium CG_4_10_14_0_2_um_filter_40_12]
MDNKERNKTILECTCELLEKLNQEVDNAFVEDIDGEEPQVLVSLTVKNPGGLIGMRGRNMAALQLVLSLIVRVRLGEWVRVLLDINNYRDEQKTRLQTMVKELSQKVLDTGKEVSMTSMSSYERRLCHMAIQDIEGVVSESEGEGEMRHIVIKLKSPVTA